MSERLLFELKAVDNATAPLRQVQNEIKKTASATNAFGQQMDATTRSTRKLAMGAFQQAGYQIGDFAVQVANGTSKMQAMGQQLPQFLQIFGPIGAVVGAGVAIFAAFGTVMQKTGADVTDSAAMQIAAIDALNDAIKETIANINELRFGGSAAKFAESEISKLKSEMSSIQSQILDYRSAIETATTGAEVDAAILAKDIAEAELPALQDTLVVMQDKLKVLYQNLRVQEGLSALEEASRIQNLRKLQLIDEQQVRLENGRKLVREILFEYTDINAVIESASKVDLASVFSNAINPSSALYQFVKKTADTMLKMTDAAAAAERTQYAKLARLNAGAMGRAGAKGQGEAVSYSFVEPKKTGGGSKEDPLKTLRDQLALETELLGKTEAQQRVIQALGIDWKKYGATTFEGLTQQIEQMNELNRVAEMQKQIAESVKSSMEDAFMGIVDGTTSAKDAFKSMAAEIIKELYRVLVVQQMVGQLGTATSAGTGLLGGIGRLFGMRAMGGPVTSGQPYMVGERGPEIIVPSRNGTVVPNSQLGGGGVTVNQTINITTGVQQTVRAEIKSLMPQIADSAKAAVLDAKRRGGSYGSAFA